MLAVSRLVGMATALMHADAAPEIHADATHYNASLQLYKAAWHKKFYSTSCSATPSPDDTTSCAVQGKPLPSCACEGKLAAVAMECEPTGHSIPPPTCGKSNNTKLVLACKPGTGTIKKIDFAGYGDIAGSCSAGFKVATVGGIPSCHSAATHAIVAAACIGKTSCQLDASVVAVARGVDPCPGKGKVLAVVASGCLPAPLPPLPPAPPPPPPPAPKSCYATNTQTGNAMALYLDIPPTDAIRQETMEALVVDFHAATDHPTFGILHCLSLTCCRHFTAFR